MTLIKVFKSSNFGMSKITECQYFQSSGLTHTHPILVPNRPDTRKTSNIILETNGKGRKSPVHVRDYEPDEKKKYRSPYCRSLERLRIEDGTRMFLGH